MCGFPCLGSLTTITSSSFQSFCVCFQGQSLPFRNLLLSTHKEEVSFQGESPLLPDGKRKQVRPPVAMMNPGDETPPRDDTMRLISVDTPPASPPLLGSPTDMWLSPDMGATSLLSPPSPSPATGGDVLLGPPESLDISSDPPAPMRAPGPSFQAGACGQADLQPQLEQEDHHQLHQDDPQLLPRHSWAHHRLQRNKAAGTTAEKEAEVKHPMMVTRVVASFFFFLFFSSLPGPELFCLFV